MCSSDLGRIENPQPFSTHLLKFEKGDVIYLFTDGYSDQFGGPDGKKFTRKRLTHILSEIAALPFEAQEKRLTLAFEAWKGTQEQVDDVCLIGLQL